GGGVRWGHWIRRRGAYGPAARAGADWQPRRGTGRSWWQSGAGAKPRTTPGPVHTPASSAYTRPPWSIAKPATPCPPGFTPCPGPRVTDRVRVFISRIPSLADATSTRPDG